MIMAVGKITHNAVEGHSAVRPDLDAIDEAAKVTV